MTRAAAWAVTEAVVGMLVREEAEATAKLAGAGLGLAAPDLAAPDLAAPDLAAPDLAAPDLAADSVPVEVVDSVSMAVGTAAAAAE
jgi:hypothetical protein